MDDVVCTGCGAEPAEEAGRTINREDLVNEGWDLDGEFGERCPLCVLGDAKISEGTAGLDALAEAVGAKKKVTP